MVYLYPIPPTLKSWLRPWTGPNSTRRLLSHRGAKNAQMPRLVGRPTHAARAGEGGSAAARSIRCSADRGRTDGRTWRARRRGAGWRGRDDVDRPAARNQPNDPCSLNATGTWVAKLCLYGIFLRPQEKPRAQAQVHTRPIRGSRSDVICQVYCRSVRWLILWEPSVHILGVLLKKKRCLIFFWN